MPETNPATEPPASDPAQQTPEASATPEVPEPDGAQGDGPHREAMRYRLRLRDAEAERDALRAEAEDLRNQLQAATAKYALDLWHHEVGGFLQQNGNADRLRDREDLIRFGVDLRQALTDDGTAVDRDKANAMMQELRSARPYLFTSGGQHPVPAFHTAGGTGHASGSGWGRAITGR